MQKAEGLGWGGSMPVASVQELVRNNPENVPDRYIQNNESRPMISEVFSDLPEIPVINLSLLADGDEDERKKLDFACREWGFFQIVDHGIAEKVLHNMKAAVAGFFELPLMEKKKYAMPANDIQGYGQLFVVSDQQKLEWCDLMLLVTTPPKHKNMKYWPATLSGFKEAVEDYSSGLQRVTDEIFGNLSLLLGLEKEALKDLHREMKQSVRMNYYPPCAKPDLVLGISPHSDASTLTLLLQDNEISGLQIKYKGRWLPVKPVPNALVVNIGDIVEAWSNGMYKSIEHRAVVDEKKTRISVATFISPEDEVDVGPVEELVDDCDHPRQYRKMKYVDYMRNAFAKKLEGKSFLEFLKLERK